MYVTLRERYRYIVFFETELYPCSCVKVDVPVIGCLDPGTDNKVHAAISKLENSDCRSRFIEDSIVSGQDLFDDLFGLLYIISVRDSYNQINASCPVGGVVHYVIAGELGVRNYERDVVRSVDKSIENSTFFYGALGTCGFDEIADFERPKDNH